MPRFAANLTTLFNELPFLERFGAAASVGFQAVEFQNPFAESAATIAKHLKVHGLKPVLFNSPVGSRLGDRGLAALPDREEDFWMSFIEALDYARIIGCPRIRIICGHMRAMDERPAMEAVLISNLQRAAPYAAARGVMLLLEPLNPNDAPGYLLSTTAHALRIIDSVGHNNVCLQFDVYHCQISEGDLTGHARSLFGRYGHVQISNAPGRHEPGKGEINFPYVFSVLDGLGYDGWVGCEYYPSTTTLESLSWAREWGIDPTSEKARAKTKRA
jgi:hydroxypyruvate isomerase